MTFSKDMRATSRAKVLDQWARKTSSAERLTKKDKVDLFKLWREVSRPTKHFAEMENQDFEDLMQQMASAAQSGLPMGEGMDMNFDSD